MLKAQLRDAAASAAKGYGHEQVEPRHVVYAVVRQFRTLPELEPLFESAKNALEPRGGAVSTPTFSPEADAMLESINNPQQAVEAAVKALEGSDASPKRHSGVETKQQDDATRQPRPSAETTRLEAESVPELLAELDSLIGLNPVKARIRDIMAVVQANAAREAAGLKAVNPSLHLVFTGPPGTGKTTVARLVARLYAATGALPGSNFTEASRADLIAGYVGQTAIKTTELINKTRPGVLFIDEAYALTPRSDVDFGTEAIATLVKAMEDNRKDLAIVVAGYGDEMATFVGSNPGLRSRFKNYVDFPDYDATELTAIFVRFAEESGVGLGKGVREKAERIFREVVNREHFGNARFARSLFEQAYVRMAARAAEDNVVTVDELMELAPEDLELEVDTLHRETKRIGFGDGDG